MEQLLLAPPAAASLEHLPFAAMFAAGAAAWFALPLLPAWRELRKPQDNQPLEVSAAGVGVAAERFARAGELHAKGASALEIAQQTGVLWAAAVTLEDRVSSPSALQAQLRLQGLVSAASWAGMGAVIVRKTWAQLDAIQGDALVVPPAAHCRAQLCSEGTIFVHDMAQFQVAQADLIVAMSSAPLHSSRTTVAWDVFGEHKPVGEKREYTREIQGAAWRRLGSAHHEPAHRNALGYWSAKQDLDVPPWLRIKGDLVCKSDIKLGPASLVEGTIRSEGTITVAAGAQVTGDCLAKHVILEESASVRGSILAEKSVTLGASAQVGCRAQKASVLADTVLMRPRSRVFGSVRANSLAQAQASSAV